MKLKKVNEQGWAHWLLPVFVICAIAFVGIHVLKDSHASSLNVQLGKATLEINPAYKKRVLNQFQVAPEAAGGILPPSNPSESLAPVPNFNGYCDQDGGSANCVSNAVLAINNARAVLESLGSINLNEEAFEKMTGAEQIFVITNLERIDRGLPPAVALTSQLNNVALAGANTNNDPNLGGYVLTGGVKVYTWGSNWAGISSAISADYLYMYDDGYPSTNVDCTYAGAPGCWGHRDNILYPNYVAGCPSGGNIYMGAAYANSIQSSALILAGGCGATQPTDEVLTWQQALTLLSAPIAANGNGILQVYNSEGQPVSGVEIGFDNSLSTANCTDAWGNGTEHYAYTASNGEVNVTCLVLDGISGTFTISSITPPDGYQVSSSGSNVHSLFLIQPYQTRTYDGNRRIILTGSPVVQPPPPPPPITVAVNGQASNITLPNGTTSFNVEVSGLSQGYGCTLEIYDNWTGKTYDNCEAGTTYSTVYSFPYKVNTYIQLSVTEESPDGSTSLSSNHVAVTVKNE